ncbi:hypothetical protein LTR36_001167 [Oleoguttula mirabilis]|uniref:Uncharacterized protein n=1 Tax=Oleoguttula mirabilis TaxID=1507867 RepID=A0AAV9J2Y0_9PEZI|nr:hypothetical protein LTR36_001167 [Oleoguttula mirabilis]
MFLDGWIQYFTISNGHRIVGLVASDPFAIFGFILLILMIPVALILLTVTARRSVHSIFDGIRHDARYRRLRRSARISLLPTSQQRMSHRSNRATAGTKRVSFVLPQSPSTPRTPVTPKTTEASPMLKASSSTVMNSQLERGPQASPSGSTFEDICDRWIEARRPPRVELELEDADAKKQWASDFQQQLKSTAT